MEILREKLEANFLEFIKEGNGIIIGPPGVGKTHLLKKACSKLKEEKIPYLYLPIDQFEIESNHDLEELFNFRGNFIDLLRAQTELYEHGKGFLLIDAYDAARSEKSQKLFINLISRVINELNGFWQVLVSVRTYDAKKSQKLQELFPLTTGKNQYKDFETPDVFCRHFTIPKLMDEELMKTLEALSDFPIISDKTFAEFRELLKIPFNLWLFEKILSLNPSILKTEKISSQIQLLNLFWSKRVAEGPLGDEKQILLTKSTKLMVNKKALSIRKEEVFNRDFIDAWKDLFSSDILVETMVGQRISFSHNILFDYAVSVLLIDEIPAEFEKFILEDPSRPLFLRPSLYYYFTHLWLDEPELYWGLFWFIMPSRKVEMNFFLRLIPITVIANETREIENLNPLVNSIEMGNEEAKYAIVHLFRALKAFEIENEELWALFLEKISYNLHEEFAWEFSSVLYSIIGKAKEKENSTVLKLCGKASRNFFNWIWKKREDNKGNVDWIGQNLAISLVVKTLNTEISESRLILEKVLHLTKEKDFPIMYIYDLIRDLGEIWPYDPEFASLIFICTFSHFEISREPTSFGTPILHLSSTRLQDYQMCQYSLVQQFPRFLQEKPEIATKAAVLSLNKYVIEEHIIPFIKQGYKLQDLKKSLIFEEKEIYYYSDGCFIWDTNEYIEEPMELINELFNYVEKLALESKENQLNSILKLIIENAEVSVFWRRLLLIASKKPDIFAKKLVNLCSSTQILIDFDTTREVGDFINNAANFFTQDELILIEETIIKIPNNESDPRKLEFLEETRDRLLASIPKELIKTEEGHQIRDLMDQNNKIPINEPFIKWSKTEVEYVTDEMCLNDQGIDLSLEENKQIFNYFKPLKDYKTNWQNKVPDTESIDLIFPIAYELYYKIHQESTADEEIVNLAWTHLAGCVSTMSRGITETHTEILHFCKKVLLECSNSPLPKYDPKYHSKFDHPYWSPAPRNEAALGLTSLASKFYDNEILIAVKKLALEDDVPSVRYLVTRGFLSLWKNNQDFFWDISQEIAENEQNQTILDALCNNLSHFVENNKIKTEELFKVIFSRTIFTSEPNIENPLISIVVGLSINYDNLWAKEVINLFLEDPNTYSKHLEITTFNILQYIIPKNLNSPESIKLIEKAIKLLLIIINTTKNAIEKFKTNSEITLNDEEKAKVNSFYNIFHEIIIRLYFAASRNEKDAENISEEKRRNYYLKIKPILKRILEIFDDNKNVLSASNAHYFMDLLNCTLKYDPKDVIHMASIVVKSSEKTNYNLDHMAMKQIMNLGETILADYRDIIKDGEPFEDFLVLLDSLVKVGWPEAINFTYRLDEVYR